MRREARDYTREYYEELEWARESAREILSILVRWLAPKSLVDVGCGTGNWVAAALELGIDDVLGVDGEWVKNAELAISSDRLVIHDLRTRFTVARRFDLALSLEVGEHLPASSAGVLVQSLCGLSDVVLFSAAIPGQGGRRHLNEQWPSYWAQLFAEQEFDCHDILRPQIWLNPHVAWYYAQNALIFARRGPHPELGPPAIPLPLVHPSLWSAELERLNSPAKLLERLPKAILSRLKRRIRLRS
jgi:SAM-dependent methyltransferase